MIAASAFGLFSIVFLGGAIVTALARQPALAALGLFSAILSGAGLCVLLDAVALALGLVALALAASAGLNHYLSAGLGGGGVGQALNRRLQFVGGGLAAGMLLLQIVLAVFDVRLLPQGQPEDPLQAATAAADLSTGALSASDIVLLALTLLLAVVGVVAGLSLSGHGNADEQGARRVLSHPLRAGGPVSGRGG
ncbi:MAG: hypothetical protein AAF965_03615 [Pseudomonadota bacterium]